MKSIMALITPFQKGSHTADIGAWIFWIAALCLLWQFGLPASFPVIYSTNPNLSTITAFKGLLLEDGLIPNTWASLTIQLIAMVVATVISLSLAYLSACRGIKPLVKILAAMRGVAPVALVPFLMIAVTRDGYYLKIALMTIAIAGFYMTAMAREVENTTKANLNYAYTLKAGPWEALKEITIRGKLHLAYDALTQNFLMGWAMLLTVEALVQGGGGIGRLMYHDQRHSNLSSLAALVIWSAGFGIVVDKLFTLLGRKIFVYVPKEAGQ